jgi:putative membrane protein
MAMGTSKAVRYFAQTLLVELGGVNRQAVTLAKRLQIKPEDSEVVRQLKADADATRKTLDGLSGAAFDSAYIDHEVTFHQHVLAVMDRTLIPGAQDDELKRLVSQSRPVIVSHLAKARAIQRALRNG